MHEHPFYGKEILRDREADYIRAFLKQFSNEPVTEELRRKIYDALTQERYLGRISIPLRVVMRRDSYGKYPDYIEIILDTKV